MQSYLTLYTRVGLTVQFIAAFWIAILVSQLSVVLTLHQNKLLLQTTPKTHNWWKRRELTEQCSSTIDTAVLRLREHYRRGSRKIFKSQRTSMLWDSIFYIWQEIALIKSQLYDHLNKTYTMTLPDFPEWMGEIWQGYAHSWRDTGYS